MKKTIMNPLNRLSKIVNQACQKYLKWSCFWGTFLYWLAMSGQGWGYVRSPYLNIDKQAFQIQLNYLGDSGGDAATPFLATMDGVFRFNDMFFGIQPRTSRVLGRSFTETQYMLGWHLLDKAAMGPVTWSMQLGAYSLGASDLYKQSALGHYLVEYAWVHRIDSNKHPWYTVITMYSGNNKSLDYGAIVGMKGQSQSLFFEYDWAIKQLFFGIDYEFLPNIMGSFAVNISGTQASAGVSDFKPLVSMGLNIVDVFRQAPKKKPEKPLPVDNMHYLIMEKALLAFQSERYEAAANYYSQVVAAYPTFVLAHVRLGNSYFQLKQWKMAEAAWSRALALDPSNDDVFMALVRLKNREYQTESFIN